MKRDDLLHPVVSGNKWRKLCYNLQLAKEQEKKTLVTFGGAYSNHIHAVAAAGHLLGFQTIGLIRGEEPKEYGATLAFAKSRGMSFRFLSRSVYRKKTVPVDLDLTNCYLLPEGGTNELAIKGCGDIVKELLEQLPGSTPTHYCLSCGTGGTIAGVINELAGRKQVTGFSALKGDFMKAELTNLQKQYELPTYGNWTVNCEYHFGGYAKHKKELLNFMIQFHQKTGVALDPVYTGKMVYGVLDLVAKDYFPRGTNVVLIHTGGLQGVLGFNERYGEELPVVSAALNHR